MAAVEVDEGECWRSFLLHRPFGKCYSASSSAHKHGTDCSWYSSWTLYMC